MSAWHDFAGWMAYIKSLWAYNAVRFETIVVIPLLLFLWYKTSMEYKLMRLFDENDKYTPEAMTLEEVACSRGIDKAVEAARERGCSMREMSALLHAAVEQAIVSAILASAEKVRAD